MATEPQPNPTPRVITTSPGSDNNPLNSAATSFSQQGLKYLFSFICLIISLLYWPPAYDAAGVPRQALLAICAGFALTLFCVRKPRAITLSWHPVHVMMLALLAWAMLSYVWSVDTGSSLLAITQLTSLILLAIIASQLSVQTVLGYIIPVTLLSASLAGLIAIGQKFNFNPMSFRMFAHTPSSTFINPNYASNYFDLMAPVALATLLLQPASAKIMKFVAASTLTLTTSCLIICQSRGSWLGLVAELVIFSIICLRNTEFRRLFISILHRNRNYLLVSLAMTLVIVVLPGKFHSDTKIHSIIAMKPDSSTKVRLDIYRNALVGIADKPLLGVGYGAFIMGFSPYTDAVYPIKEISPTQTIRYMHSDILQMFFELGIPGGLLSLAIYFLIVAMCWRIIGSNADSQLRLLGMGLLLAIIASGAHACVDFPLHLPTSAYFFWLWTGLVIGLYLRVFHAKTVRIPRITPITAWAVGLLFSIYSTQLYAGYLRANRDIFTAMKYAKHGNCNAVLRYSDNAMNEFGLDHFTRFWYAKAYTYCDAPAKEKLVAMDRILALDPNMPLPYLTRARLELAKGNLERAANDFNNYRKLLPHEPGGYIGLARITSRLGHKSQARYWLELAAKHSPNNPEVQQLVKQLNLK